MTRPAKAYPANEATQSQRDAEDLLERMELRDGNEEKQEKEGGILNKLHDMATFARRANKTWDGAQALYDKVKPVARILTAPVRWAYGHLKDIFTWNAFEHQPNGKLKLDEQGDPIFAPMRLARAFATAAFMGMAVSTAMAGAYFHTTHFEETIVTTGKEMIDPGQLYEFTGCTSLPCSTTTDNGKYYHIQGDFLYPTLLRPEQDVFAHIPKETGVCHIEGYGIYFRELKWLFNKWTDWYQNVYNVTCRPLTQQEIQHSIDTGILPSVEQTTNLSSTGPASFDTVTPSVTFQQPEVAL